MFLKHPHNHQAAMFIPHQNAEMRQCVYEAMTVINVVLHMHPPLLNDFLRMSFSLVLVHMNVNAIITFLPHLSTAKIISQDFLGYKIRKRYTPFTKRSNPWIKKWEGGSVRGIQTHFLMIFEGIAHTA